MKLFIPAIGTQIKLTKDWTFTVHPEYRNHDLYEMANRAPVTEFLYGDSAKYGPQPFTLPAGVTLVVDRIYIRKPSPEYNSVTFRIPSKCVDNSPEFRGIRFWVKLVDANTIEGDIIP